MATTIKWGLGLQAGPHAKAPMPPDPSCQPCPDCGGLECLCRPRFFAGQLLTERDLNLLDHYIVEKHKLHNRHLWGTGVVCGLEVRCAPCDDLVTVSAGYALSPCGEDIVVCKPDKVDICALIARCRNDSEPDCRPHGGDGKDECGDVIDDWILAIRYAESPSRGITPLTGAGQGCGCSCGGGCAGKTGGSCGCGCPTCSPSSAESRLAPATLKSPRLNRGAPPSCEPTVVCESYRYDVYRAPTPKVVDPDGVGAGLAGLVGSLEGDMFQKVRCCLQQLQAILPAPPGTIGAPIPAGDRQAWFKWCCAVRTALGDYLAVIGGTDCEAIGRLKGVVCPDPQMPVAAFTAALDAAEAAYGLIVLEAIFNCFCSAALPPCPPAGDPRVPLALVKVRRKDCHIVSVCDWTPLRKHVLTFPTLTYWLGWLPIARMIRAFMHTLCCDLFDLPDQFDRGDDPAQPIPGAGAIPQGGDAIPVGGGAGGDDMFADAVALNPFGGAKLDLSLFEAIGLSVQDKTVPTKGDVVKTAFSRKILAVDPELHGEERDEQVRRLADSAPLKLLGGMFGGAGAILGGAAPSSGVARDVAALKETVARQSAEIEALRARIDK